MFRNQTLLFPLLLIALFTAAQKPSISKQTDLKQKLTSISKAFPEVKKSLTKKDPYDSEKLIPKISIGDFDGKYKEDGEKATLEYKFSSSVYAGTQDEFKTFYETTVGMIKELFADNYEPSEMTPGESRLSTHFYEKEKEFKSNNWMSVSFTWSKYSMYVHINFYGK